MPRARRATVDTAESKLMRSWTWAKAEPQRKAARTCLTGELPTKTHAVVVSGGVRAAATISTCQRRWRRPAWSRIRWIDTPPYGGGSGPTRVTLNCCCLDRRAVVIIGVYRPPIGLFLGGCNHTVQSSIRTLVQDGGRRVSAARSGGCPPAAHDGAGRSALVTLGTRGRT